MEPDAIINEVKNSGLRGRDVIAGQSRRAYEAGEHGPEDVRWRRRGGFW